MSLSPLPTPQRIGSAMGERRIRVGIARFSDGWNVVAEIDGERSVYDPTFATEAEAEAKVAEVSAALRDVFGVTA